MMKVAFLMQCHKNEHPEYIKLFKHSLCPDECFFQTLVMNSPFAGSVKPYLHYIKWEKGKSSPRTCRMAVLRLSCVWPHRWLGVLLYVDSARESSPKNRGGGTLAWVGEHSLEVYLTHYLLLSLIKLDEAPILYSPTGLSMVLVNYMITVALTVMAIVMMNPNAVLSFVLTGKKK